MADSAQPDGRAGSNKIGYYSYLPCAMSASKELANNAGKFRTLMGVSLLGFEFLPAKIGGMCHEEKINWLSK